MTPGKTGSLLGERLKGADKTVSRLKVAGLHSFPISRLEWGCKLLTDHGTTMTVTALGASDAGCLKREATGTIGISCKKSCSEKALLLAWHGVKPSKHTQGNSQKVNRRDSDIGELKAVHS